MLTGRGKLATPWSRSAVKDKQAADVEMREWSVDRIV
jgi:hypothetical protein